VRNRAELSATVLLWQVLLEKRRLFPLERKILAEVIPDGRCPLILLLFGARAHFTTRPDSPTPRTNRESPMQNP